MQCRNAAKYPFNFRPLVCAAFGLGTGDHDLPAAGAAYQLKIHAAAGDGEFLPAAGVLFLHQQNIADADIHGSPSFAIKSILYYTTGEKILQ